MRNHSVAGAGLRIAILIAIIAHVHSAAASCENVIVAQSPELRIWHEEIYPVRLDGPRTPASESTFVAAGRAMWQGMARGLATAVACQRRIDADPRLKTLLRRAPIHLAKYDGRPIEPASAADRSVTAPADSILGIFRSLDRDSVAVLFSIRLGSFSSQRAARRCVDRFAALERLRARAGWDSSLVMDWNHQDCSVGSWDRPTLFVLPPPVSGDGRWMVLSGLFVARRDALRSQREMPAGDNRTAPIVPIHVTGSVLSVAIPPQ